MTNNGVARPKLTSDMVVNYLLTSRTEALRSLVDPRRDIDNECGYPRALDLLLYKGMYDREGIATRVVSIYPDECWAVEPEVYEVEEPRKTLFEEAWDALLESEDTNPYHYLHRADVLSGIGRYGVILLGLNDSPDLSQPVPGLKNTGEMDKKTPTGIKLLYMRCFDESIATIKSLEADTSNPRFGKPLLYNLKFTQVSQDGTSTTIDKDVHWTRVIHLADNRECSEVYGIPRMQDVFNRLCDVRKILGGSAEMFWKGGFPGYSFELNPELMQAGVTLDSEGLREQFEAYSNGLQRYLAIVGLQAKSLAPQVANPEGNLAAQLQAIALTKGVPLRIFMGAEQAQLASGQDVRTWNRRLSRRHQRYLTPMAIRPMVDRFIAFGILPKPGNRYKVWWPDVNLPSDDEKSQIAERNTASLMKYVMGGAYQVIPPREYLTIVLGLTSDQAEVIMKAAAEWASKPKFEITPPNKDADQDTGNQPANAVQQDNPGGDS